MSSELFVISNDGEVYGFYVDLEKAKNKLLNIKNKTCDYKHYGYKISVYNLVDNEFIITDTRYIYILKMYCIQILTDLLYLVKISKTSILL